MKILYIEDDLNTAELLVEYMEDNKYEITHCDTVTSGLSYLKQNKFDILLLDLNLPDYFGLKVCEELNKNEHLPIIILSAYSELDTKLKAFELGVDDYICKPYNLKELNARIISIINRTNYHENNPKENNDIFTVENDKITFKNKILSLTNMEFLILSELIKNKNNIILREYFLEKFELPTHSRSIDYHIKNIRKKLSDNTKTPKYLITEYGIGYKVIF